MSKIGKNPIVIPQWVEVSIQESLVTVKWPKGVLSFTALTDVIVVIEWSSIITTCDNQELWKYRWTTRAILAHMVQGVYEWYRKSLQVIWVWYDAALQWSDIQFKLGFSHVVRFSIPNGVEVKIDKDPKWNSIIHLESHDKQLIWQTASKIRDLKRPEPYKGKGIRYLGEVIKLKAGKTAKK